MKKITIVLKKYRKHPENYGVLTQLDWDQLAWRAIKDTLGDNDKYLNHFINSRWRDTSKVDGFHKVNGTKIPYGVLTYTLDIYFERQR